MILNVENPQLRGVATTGLGLDAGMNQSLTGLAQAGNRLMGETALLPQPAAVYANELVRPTLSGLPALASDTAYQAGFQMPGFLANQVLPGAGVLVTGAARGGATYGQQRRAGRGELTSLLAAGVDAVGIDNILRAGLQTIQENGILLPGGTQPTDPTPAPSPAADTPSTPGPNAVTSPLFPTEGAGEKIVGSKYDKIRPTQDVVNPKKVEEYAKRLKAGEKIPPVQVIEVLGKGQYIINGHHRYVASLQTGIPVEIKVVQNQGPIGMPDWSSVQWKEYISEDQFWGD